MSATVVRRFDLRVDQAKALGDVRDRLLGLVATEPGVSRTEIKPFGGLSLLEVRLEGNVSAISAVMGQLAEWPTLRIEHDAIRVLRDPDVRGALLRAGVDRDWSGPGSGVGVPSAPVTVAIVDSGIMVDHPDLKGRLWTGTVDGAPAHGARCIGGTRTGDVTDRDGHGTGLAGTVLSVARSAPGVRLLAVKFFDADTLPGPANGADGIDFAVEQGADIINLSWDLGIGSVGLEQAIQNACDAGALVVIAAGNSGTDNDAARTIPAYYRKERPDRIVTVMATDRYNDKASFSNYGVKTVDLAAPGVDVVTARAALATASGVGARSHSRFFKGTSAAAAMVAGAAALLKSRHPGLTADDLKTRLVNSADAAPRLKCRHGRLNVARALADDDGG